MTPIVSRKRGSKTPAKAKASASSKTAVPNKGQSRQDIVYDLKLYVAGSTTKSIAATRNLQAFCEKHLHGQYRITIIDLLVTPQLAAGDQIVAIPTLVRKLPVPIRKIIGDLSNEERVLVGMQITRRAGE